MEFKYQIIVEKLEESVNTSNPAFQSNSANFLISNTQTLDKLVKIIEIYFEELKGKPYQLIYGDINIKEMNINLYLGDVLIISEDEPNKVVNLLLKYDNSSVYILEVECIFRSNSIKTFQIDNKLSFKHFKFNVLALFPELEEENYSIIYSNSDISNFFDDNTVISDIFLTPQENKIRVFLDIKPKNIVEYHKRCSYCIETKALTICNKCAICHCDPCSKKDQHSTNRTTNFINLPNFKTYEQDTLSNFLKKLNEKQGESSNLNSNDFGKIMNEKIQTVEKKFNDLIDLLVSIKNIQINNLKLGMDLVRNKYKPEDLEKLMNSLYEVILKYKANPYYDCEESMKKILEFEKLFKIFLGDFEAYKFNLNDLINKFFKCLKIANNVEECLKIGMNETKTLFKKTIKETKFHQLVKIYDSKSVVIYDHNSEEFSLLNFIDIENKFSEHFNNYVQVNYPSEGRVFIITGNPCQKLFCYNISTNEMELVNTLKFNHNWWPVILATKSSEISKIKLFCLSGTYTKKCEQLQFTFGDTGQISQSKQNIYSFEWTEIPSLNVAHGQATAFIQNENDIYVLFGYDYNFVSISTVERLNLNGGTSWELIEFKNPHSISSILYYHSLLKPTKTSDTSNTNNCYIFGGLKEVNEGDVVYNYDLVEGNLLKTNYNFELTDVKFSYEKVFTCIDLKGENNTYSIFDSKNNIHILNLNLFEHKMRVFNLN